MVSSNISAKVSQPTVRFSAKLAEKPETEATVAILDTFGEKGSHGEFVESLVLEGGFQDRDIQRYDNTFEFPKELLDHQSQGFGKRLDSFIQENPIRLLTQTGSNLQDVLQRSQAKVVNISMGDSKIDTVSRLLSNSKQNRYYGQQLWRELGLSSGAEEKTRIQALANRIDNVLDKSSTVRRAKSEFHDLVETAKDNDVHVVLAAGNRGHLADAYEQAGIQVQEDFFASHLNVEGAIMVGASNSSGERARFTPANAGVDLAAPGTFVVGKPHGRPEVRDGTSYAAPKVTRALAQFHQEFPNDSLAQREARLHEKLTPRPGEESHLGAGVLLD